MGVFEEYIALARIRQTMDSDLYEKLMSLGDDDHYHILKDNAPPDYWNDSITVQVWLKLGLIKKKINE